MGTSYHITLVAGNIDLTRLKFSVDSLLEKFNLEMSNWISDSEISRFNRHASVEPFNISDDFYYLMKNALKISEQTNGAFDVTVSPLIEAWGFGQKKRPVHSLDQAVLDSIQAFVGYQKIGLAEGNLIYKTDPRVTINLSAIAKGYAVDKIADFLKGSYSKNFLVEIGGEIVASGHNQSNQKWTVGIRKPEFNLILNNEIQHVIQIRDQALATSGDYINYYELDGKRYSHTIDPTTLKPITHQLASVSLVAGNCLEADAIATAITVMGLEKALIWLKSSNYEAYLIQRNGDKFMEYYTDGFQSLLP